MKRVTANNTYLTVYRTVYMNVYKIYKYAKKNVQQIPGSLCLHDLQISTRSRVVVRSMPVINVFQTQETMIRFSKSSYK